MSVVVTDRRTEMATTFDVDHSTEAVSEVRPRCAIKTAVRTSGHRGGT